MLTAFGAAAAEGPPAKAAASGAPAKAAPEGRSPKAAAKAQFGINPEGITSPEMRDALTILRDAGVVEGRRGSLTFFRWADGTPPRLAHLGLWGPMVGNEQLARIAALPDLEFVSLYETAVDDAGFAVVAKLPKLRHLAITPVTRYEKASFGPPQWSYPFLPIKADRPRLTAKSLSALAGVATLESLDLLDAGLDSADLALLAKWPKLSAVALPNAVDAETVEHLRACRRLGSLTLGHRAITAEELTTLAACTSIRRLTLVHARLSDEALQAIGRLTAVEELHLRDCGLTDDRLAHLRGGPRLTSLWLDRNEIAGPGLAHLAGLKLSSLSLGFNNLSDATLTHLKQLDTLGTLGISYCPAVTDAGIRGGTLQGMTHLKRLNLRGLKQVTDATLDDLVRFGHLEHITIRETKISPAGVERMKKAMPNTVVFK
mgnify:CR=1 FL=1